MKLSVFNIKISLVSTTRLAGEERIKEILDLDSLPADIRPLLRQEVLPSEALAPLTRQKSRAMRLLLKHATHNPLGGWNIGQGSETLLLEGLKEVRDGFYADKADLLGNLDAVFEAHLAELRKTCVDAGYAHTDAFIQAIRAAQPTAQYLDRQIRFEYLSPRVVTYEDEAEIAIVREGVYGQSLHEIAMRALESSRAKAIKSRLRCIDEIVGKFEGLSYIEPRLGTIAAELNAALGGIPRALREIDYSPLQGMAVAHALTRLSDEDGLAAAVERQEPLFQAPADDAPDMLDGVAAPTVSDTTSDREPEPEPSSGTASESRVDHPEHPGHQPQRVPTSHPASLVW